MGIHDVVMPRFTSGGLYARVVGVDMVERWEMGYTRIFMGIRPPRFVMFKLGGLGSVC
jgi:hypothetical protein